MDAAAPSWRMSNNAVLALLKCSQMLNICKSPCALIFCSYDDNDDYDGDDGDPIYGILGVYTE